MNASELKINAIVDSIWEIFDVRSDEIKNSDGAISYHVSLLMLGGDCLCLCSASNRREQQKITELIRSYLKARSR